MKACRLGWNEFNQFNEKEARISDYIYHLTLKVFCYVRGCDFAVIYATLL